MKADSFAHHFEAEFVGMGESPIDDGGILPSLVAALTLWFGHFKSCERTPGLLIVSTLGVAFCGLWRTDVRPHLLSIYLAM